MYTCHILYVPVCMDVPVSALPRRHFERLNTERRRRTRSDFTSRKIVNALGKLTVLRRVRGEPLGVKIKTPRLVDYF